MVNKRKRKRRGKPDFSVQAGKRLAAWSRKLASEALSEEEERRMEAMVDKHLAAGRDEVFERAFAELGDDEEAFWELEEFLEFNSEVVPVVTATVEGPPSHFALLFAVPVVFSLAPGGQIPASLEGNNLDAAAKSFKRHGLIGSEASLVLAGDLYLLDQVHLPYSRRRTALSRMVRFMSKGRMDAIFPAVKPSRIAEAPFLALRFLVGAVVFGEEEGIPFSELPEDRLERWAKEIGEMLSGPDIQAFVEGPAHFGQALRDGVDMFRLSALALKAGVAAEKAAAKRKSCLVEAEEEGSEVRFRFLDEDGRLLEEYTFPIFDHDLPETWTDMWIEMLRWHGIQLVWKDEERVLH